MHCDEVPIHVSVQQPVLAKYRVEFFRRLNQIQDFDVKVAYAEQPGFTNVEPCGFESERRLDRKLPLVGKWLLWNSSQLRLADPSRSDVLVLPANLRYLSLYAAMFKAKRRGVHTVLWGHHKGKRKAGSGWIEGRRLSLLKSADAVVCYGFEAAEELRSRGVPDGAVFVAPNAIDQAPIERSERAYRQRPNASSEFREQFGLKDRKLIVFVSRPKPRNRIDRFVRVIAELIHSGHPIDAAVIGTHNEVVEELRSLAAEKGIERHVHFPGAIYDEDELAPWFCEASAMYFPEQIGLSAHHALGYGVPVVAGSATGRNNPEIELIRDGENGFLVDSEDEGAARDALLRLVNDSELRDRMSKAARATVRDRYGMEQMVSGFADAIRYVVGRK
jgi:glycosyltransferase involved in cell wall biosynthesis